MGEWTDQDEAREGEGRIAPPTTPDAAPIAEDRAAVDQAHVADRPPTVDEEAAAESAEPVDPEVAQAYEEAMERGAKQEGEGRIP